MHKRKGKRWLAATVVGGALAAGTFTLLPASAQAGPVDAAGGQSATQADFAAAAAEYKVPVSVLLGVAREESGLQSHTGYSNNAGWGFMNLTDATAQMLAQGPSGIPAHSDLTSAAKHPELHTLLAAAKLTGIPADSLRHNLRDNLRGGAALLASYQKQLTGGTSDQPSDWTAAIAKYSQMADEKAATSFTSDVFASIRSGVRQTTSDGQLVTEPADPSAAPVTGQLGELKLTKAVGPSTPAECPKSLDCQFVQASSTGLQVSNRPANGITINQIVLHTTESSYDSTIQTFQGPNAAAAHYVMRSSDGAVTQMVSDKDVAFGDNNYDSNLHAIQIEHEGFSAFGADWYTDVTYQQTAKLVKYLVARYNIPLDRQHILAHDNVPGGKTADLAGQHWDMGDQWDWTRFMKLIGAPFDDKSSGVGPVGSAVTIAPTFKKNLQTFTVCPADDPTGATTACTPVTIPASSLFVHQGPSEDSPLILDANVHPTATSGTNDVSDWTTTVQAGQQFVVADQQGDWTAIWFDGQEGWIDNPNGTNTIPATGVKIIQAAGTTAAPVYGTAFPDPSEVPTGWGADPQNPLTAPNYAIPAGQAYVADQPPVNGQDFFPSRQGVVNGAKQYYTVQFNHRYVYVNAADVTATAV
ncbi:N-acetylmuramoyl-L-alanine amidase [Streptomyces sp. DvalAA-14]|uniref:peptidoglycan recognition protein family protein n=1 Tax=unclassified Streptomyces TaxID=2593676 RepID=UPI00081B2BEA|nr:MULTISPECIES: peptidoglycan recognition family protein [unclassified Streptomyces]MYS22303.1 N-acetylmuramoyl-L-alanine amidase [Streptomyces sp. SID4948]SCE13458.1 N-acetylmuramoyl-L-alanine amidase [Streptomyces sp. DvalAA-14]